MYFAFACLETFHQIKGQILPIFITKHSEWPSAALQLVTTIKNGSFYQVAF